MLQEYPCRQKGLLQSRRALCESIGFFGPVIFNIKTTTSLVYDVPSFLYKNTGTTSRRFPNLWKPTKLNPVPVV